MKLTNEQINHFYALYEKADLNLEGLIFINESNSNLLDDIKKKKLREAIIEFKECLSMVPDHWQSMWLMAKAYQRLGEHQEAFESLEPAFQIESNNYNIALEASLEAIELQKNDKALYYSKEALKIKPDNTALLGNHAMILMIAKYDDEAKVIIEKALELNPHDKINKSIENFINKVISKEIERPTSLNYIEGI